MPSFDVVNKVDLQEVENAVNNARKVITNRYDFRGSDTTIDLDKKEPKITVETSDSMKLKSLDEELVAHLVRRGVSGKALERKDPEPATKGRLRQVIVLKQGIDKDTARQIVKWIKDSKIKVTAQIQDEQVRVTGKQIDDLQAVIALLKAQKELELPLQFVNMQR
jgi:uncharacterized protein YajQ (UPF0234 family)